MQALMKDLDLAPVIAKNSGPLIGELILASGFSHLSVPGDRMKDFTQGVSR